MNPGVHVLWGGPVAIIYFNVPGGRIGLVMDSNENLLQVQKNILPKRKLKNLLGKKFWISFGSGEAIRLI